jgi:hypothetical protein
MIFPYNNRERHSQPQHNDQNLPASKLPVMHSIGELCEIFVEALSRLRIPIAFRRELQKLYFVSVQFRTDTDCLARGIKVDVEARKGQIIITKQEIL